MIRSFTRSSPILYLIFIKDLLDKINLTALIYAGYAWVCKSTKGEKDSFEILKDLTTIKECVADLTIWNETSWTFCLIWYNATTLSTEIRFRIFPQRVTSDLWPEMALTPAQTILGGSSQDKCNSPLHTRKIEAIIPRVVPNIKPAPSWRPQCTCILSLQKLYKYLRSNTDTGD